MVDASHVVINGNKYQLAHDELVPRGKRAWVRNVRPADISDPGVIKTARWNVSGPMGESRERPGPDGGSGFLGVDYTDNLDHRYDGLLTSTAKRNALSLTGLTQFAYRIPIGDVTKTNWSEGAGDGDGDAFDELDDGVELGPADDATTYWTTTSSGVANRLECSLTTGLTQPGVNTDHTVLVRARGTAADTYVVILKQGGVTITSDTATIAVTNTWESYSLVLTEATAAAITDYDDLEIAVYKVSGSNAFDVTGFELKALNSLYGNIITFDNNFSFLFANRGGFSTQIDPVTMTEIQNNSRTNRITDSAVWQGEGLIAHGDLAIVDKRTAATGSGATYSTITGVDATHLAVGADRLWLADAGLTTAADKGRAKFTANAAALTSAALSNSFAVADPSAAITGFYTTGPYTVMGFDRGVNSFTSSGKSVRLLEAVSDFPSSANAASGDSLWGWLYIATKFGLFAINIEDRITNPVGPGEGLQGQGFEGPIDGYPTAVAAIKDSVWVAYLNPDGTSYVFRGTFGPQTAATGRPEWYSFRKLPALECHAIGMVERANPTLVLGEDEDVAYYTLSTRGREIADSNYEFDTGGGQWFGTTMMRTAGKLINVRSAKLLTENCVASTDTWQVAVSLDEGSYIDVGSAITANGLQVVRPTSAGVPLTTVNGSYLKPRLTQVASSESAPPQVRGFLDIEYDERPQTIEDHQFLIVLGAGDFGSETEFTNISTLFNRDNASAQSPQTFTLPGSNVVQYGFITAVSERLDLDNHGTQGVQVIVQEWKTA